MTAYNKNAVTHYALPTDGSTDCITAANLWCADIAAMSPTDTFTLTIPNAANGGSDHYNFGIFSVFSTGGVGGRTVTINIQDDINITGLYALHYNQATYNTAVHNHSARLENVAPTDTTITLKELYDHAIFDVGRWILVGGCDIQGYGAPPAPRIYAHAKIVAKNTSTGVLTLDRALGITVRDNWIEFNPGNLTFEPDLGGPATAWLFTPQYDCDLTFNLGDNVWFERDDGGLTYCQCRKYTINGGSNSGLLGVGVCSSASEQVNLNNVRNGEFLNEIDKMFGVLSANGATYNRVHTQSGIGEGHFQDTTVETTLETLRLTYLEGGNDIFQLWCGPTSFAWTDELHISGVNTIGGPILTSGMRTPISNWEWIGGGTFRTPTNSNNTLRIAAENPMVHVGNWFWFNGSRDFGKPFEVLDVSIDEGFEVTDDGGYIYSHTSLEEYPTFDMGTSGFAPPDQFRVMWCHRIFSEGGIISSDPDVLALNHHPWGRPHGEYNERTISGPQTGSIVASFPIIGEFEWIEIEIERPYTGTTQSSCKMYLANFGFHLMNDTTYERPSSHYVELKSTARTILIEPGGVVTGAIGADGLSDPINGWICEGLAPIIAANTTGDTSGQQAIVHMRAKTNMGPTFDEEPPPVTASAFGRPRLRLR